MVKEYTESQLEALKKAFLSMPTFEDGPNGGTVKWNDAPTLIELMGYERTKEEKDAAAAYLAIREASPGIFTLDEFMGACKTQHDAVAFAKYQTQLADKNGDGFISKDEFEAMLPFLACQEPLLKGFDFDKFVEEADTNKDGKISIDECANWVGTNLQGRKTE